jgi:hypothetical protein
LSRIQTVSRYIALSEEGLVPRLECPMDQGLLMPNTTMDDKDYLYCLSCNYQNFIGIKFYEDLSTKIKGAENG